MGEVRILDGNTFVVSDDAGDIDASPTEPNGLFSYDTRFLSTWALTLDGKRLTTLSVDDLQYFETRYFPVPDTGSIYVDATLSVIRQRTVEHGFHERLTIMNHDDNVVDLTVRVEPGTDFADMFEVKDALGKKGKTYTRIDHGGLTFGYERETLRRAPAISSAATADVDEPGTSFTVHIEPQKEWTTMLRAEAVMLGPDGEQVLPNHADDEPGRNNRIEELDAWLSGAPRLECDWEPLQVTYQRSLVDL